MAIRLACVARRHLSAIHLSTPWLYTTDYSTHSLYKSYFQYNCIIRTGVLYRKKTEKASLPSSCTEAPLICPAVQVKLPTCGPPHAVSTTLGHLRQEIQHLKSAGLHGVTLSQQSKCEFFIRNSMYREKQSERQSFLLRAPA